MSKSTVHAFAMFLAIVAFAYSLDFIAASSGNGKALASQPPSASLQRQAYEAHEAREAYLTAEVIQDKRLQKFVEARALQKAYEAHEAREAYLTAEVIQDKRLQKFVEQRAAQRKAQS